jgi:hypothetical protein
MCRKIWCDEWKRKYFGLGWRSEQGHSLCIETLEHVRLWSISSSAACTLARKHNCTRARRRSGWSLASRRRWNPELARVCSARAASQPPLRPCIARKSSPALAPRAALPPWRCSTTRPPLRHRDLLARVAVRQRSCSPAPPVKPTSRAGASPWSSSRLRTARQPCASR